MFTRFPMQMCLNGTKREVRSINRVFHTSYHHKTDREGRIVDIRLLGSVDVKGLLARPLKEWIDYNIYILVRLVRRLDPQEWRIYTLNKISEETGVLQRLNCIQDLKGVGMHMISPYPFSSPPT